MGSGLLQPQLVYARDLDLGRQEQLYGPFKSGASARGVFIAGSEAFSTMCCHAKVAGVRFRFARQLKHGACVGAESPLQHNLAAGGGHSNEIKGMAILWPRCTQRR